jgi:general secretion pathway protein G
MRLTILLALLILTLTALAFSMFMPRTTPRWYGERVDKPAAARASVIALNTAVDLFRKDCGAFPTQSQGMEALLAHPGVQNWQGPYISGRTLPSDPWGHPFEYRLINDIPVVRSAGPDAAWGTRDDISTAERDPITEQPEGAVTQESAPSAAPCEAHPGALAQGMDG